LREDALLHSGPLEEEQRLLRPASNLINQARRGRFEGVEEMLLESVGRAMAQLCSGFDAVEKAHRSAFFLTGAKKESRVCFLVRSSASSLMIR
jgi:hypothetical protein